MLNILNVTSGNVMLGGNVKNYFQAYKWLEYYREKYGEGKPYFNGEGTHDGVFVIVRQCECCGKYSVIN